MIPTVTTAQFHAAQARSMSEAELLAAVRRLARVHGWATVHHWRSDHSEKGWPDLALCRGERLVLAELKTERGRLTPEQQAWLERLGDVRVVEPRVWRPMDWLNDTILEELR